MTPAARVAAAIEVVDIIQAGAPAEQALTRWARMHRFAGSKDRAAIRDYVFDVVRRKRSAQALGGGADGRALMLGLFRLDGIDPAMYFTGHGYGPVPLTPAEEHVSAQGLTIPERWNLQDWLAEHFDRSLGKDAESAALLLQERAPVTLRINIAKTNASEAKLLLEEDGIQTEDNPRAATALSVVEGARKVRASRAYLEGYVELQDASSQAFVADLPEGAKVLDYCAGGGGKALAIAAQADRAVSAHDHDPKRMVDLPARAKRAGANVRVLDNEALSSAGLFDIVVCDAPCSGSGAWRRAPGGKWDISEASLSALMVTQDEILDAASRLVSPTGTLVYATCSVLTVENEIRIDRFVKSHPEWRCVFSRRYALEKHADGFFAAHLTR